LSVIGAAAARHGRELLRLGMTVDQVVHDYGDLCQAIGDLAVEREAAFGEARVRGCVLIVTAVDADRDLLFSAVGNLLQNAFKFTLPGTAVTLNAYAKAERILIDVKDHCGGLAPDVAETLFTPFTQGDADRSGLGLGLGLSIARRSVEANGGRLSVRDIPGGFRRADAPRADASAA
jgi:signal transduction histidine kinase